MKNKVSRLAEWLLYMIGYAFILILMANLFPKTIYIDEFYGLWGLLAAILIYVLNKTIKPIIVWLTLPLTALTLGLFYPLINVFILYLVSFILGGHFSVHGIWMTALVAILISLMNGILDNWILKPLTRKDHKYE